MLLRPSADLFLETNEENPIDICHLFKSVLMVARSLAMEPLQSFLMLLPGTRTLQVVYSDTKREDTPRGLLAGRRLTCTFARADALAPMISLALGRR